MSKMDHATAMRKAIAESYVLGELSEEERAEFEEHFFTCPECAEDIKALTLFLDDTKAVLGKQSMRRRLASATRRLRQGPWQSRWRLLPALAVAATVVLSLGTVIYQSAVTIPRLRGELANAQNLQTTSWHFLSVARSDPSQIRVGPQQNMIGLTLSRSGYESSARYRIDVRDAKGTQVLSSVVPAPAAGDELQLLLPVSGLQSGRYAVELSGLDSPDAPTIASERTRYLFVLKREEMK